VAYNDCSFSTPVALADSTFYCWNCGDTIVDGRDSKIYNTVLIGTQCWFAQNLNIGIQVNGAVNQTNNATIEKYCYSDNDANCLVYGGLYQWDEYMNYTSSSNSNSSGRQGICPIGWHVPYTGATNSSGFTALPGGWWDSEGGWGGGYLWLTENAEFWTSTEDSYILPLQRELWHLIHLLAGFISL
jgi:hypothetical protein